MRFWTVYRIKPNSTWHLRFSMWSDPFPTSFLSMSPFTFTFTFTYPSPSPTSNWMICHDLPLFPEKHCPSMYLLCLCFLLNLHSPLPANTLILVEDSDPKLLLLNPSSSPLNLTRTPSTESTECIIHICFHVASYHVSYLQMSSLWHC